MLSLKQQEFKQNLVQRGMPTCPLSAQEFVWLKRFQKPLIPTFSTTPRLLNRFMLGADPEFIFENPASTDPFNVYNKHRVDASQLDLRTGLFAGADQNGRLVELRPKPSRSALEVVASLVDSMRWLAMLYPDTMNYMWRSGAYLYDDGIGGHIHVGRKRPTRNVEIVALDAINKALLRVGCFGQKEVLARQKGDAHGQRYGMPSDYRLQLHGYEYRTLPSWMDSPWMAFLNLTLAKLAILNPKMVAEWLNPDTRLSYDSLANLLAFYKGQDDDAALAHAALYWKGLPKNSGNDIRKEWGVDFSALHPVDVDFQPACVAPEEKTCQEVFNYLLTGAAIPHRELTPNWTPLHPPKGFVPMIRQVKAKQIGMGELLWDVVGHEKFPVTFFPSENRVPALSVNRNLDALLPFDWKRTVRKQLPNRSDFNIQVTGTPGENPDALTISLCREWRKDSKKLQLLKRILLCGVFPLWNVKDANSDVLSQWEKPISDTKKGGVEILSLREGQR